MLARTKRLLDERIIREITPIFDTRALGYESMLVAAKVDAENPQRAAQIVNSHPGVSHNYLRTHDFNLWFTIATPPDSELGLAGTLEVLMRETGAESMRQLPTLTLFKINMNLEMEKGTDALAAAVDASPPRELDAAALRRARHRRDPRPTGADGRGRAPLRRGRRRARDEHRGAARAPARDGRPQAPAPRRGDPLPPPRRLLGQRHGRLEGARGARSWRWARRMASFRGISHCYQRPTYEDWPYSVFTMAHGRSKEECDAILDSIAEECGMGPDDRATLYSSTEYKKIRLHYFTDEYAALGGRAFLVASARRSCIGGR